MKDTQPTLVILAAGMGSRYGGLKQIDTFTAQGDTITDLSIYDAIQAEFGKIVFVIRKNLEKDFRSVFENKWKHRIKIAFVFQEIDTIPVAFDVSHRIKPWGTAHALLVAKSKIKENFALINADDFYGRDAFTQMAKQLQKTKSNSSTFCMIGYPLQNTLSEKGSVSRGQCYVDKNGFLNEIIERTKIEKTNGVLCANDDSGNYFSIDPRTPVSMNFWGFTPKVFTPLESQFLEFVNSNYKTLTKEFFLPAAISTMLQKKQATVRVLQTTSTWFGVTYPEDKVVVQQKINALKTAKVYPKVLWEAK